MMPTQEDQRISVDAREIVFIKENAPKALDRLIVESLAAQGKSVKRHTVRIQISTLKDEYNAMIIEEARKIIKSIKHVEYVPELSA